MDEVVVTLGQFQHDLEIFNDNLHRSFQELNRCHEALAPNWNDSLRTDYEARWRVLDERMSQYVGTTGQTYIEVLLLKTNALKRYLHGT